MLEIAFAIPGDIDTPTGGYAYDRRVMALLPSLGIRVQHIVLPGSFPNPREADIADTVRLIRAMDPDTLIVFDGLAYGAMPAEAIRATDRPIVALVHHPLALETGLTETRRQALMASERAALALARHVIVTSASTALMLATDFGVGPERITCAEPGTEPKPRARGTGHPVHLLCVGAVVPRKGYDVLLAALGSITHAQWRATIVGSLDRAPAHVAQLRADVERLGVSDRVILAGALPDNELDAAYDRADIFVLSSWYEGFGMVLTEAMARGLAIVSTRAGAADATLPDDAGVKVAPGDAEAMARALLGLINDEPTRRRLADAAFTRAQKLPRWNDTAARIASVLTHASQQARIV